ncbi:DUF512 domain-containing protein [Carboxydothermus pertinax]|uniref:Radical SAM domain-containing protein n=1 Tax=Carboxydothermus pertinax TaxID=870242 RepID=A0A1L8CSS3_9THEO|nr:DUF512 domain-containing protein [Carboxydothermus pertinax]GAV21962.1 radical SAM domain-containing protein [Carboxydothermus pertinax]
MEKYLAEAVKSNVLPITSRCNVRCCFCSHKGNPAKVLNVSLPHVPLKKIAQFLPFLDPEKKIIIGESATIINEGEPLLHPEFKEIILAIRKLYPRTPLSITTNGLLLTREMIEFLASLGEVELVVSVNALTPSKRKLIFGFASEIYSNLEYLSRKIPFTASFVFMPHVVGYGEYADSIKKLLNLGVEAVRVFLPGYTAKNQKLIKAPQNLNTLAEKLFYEFLEENTPIIIEPTRLKDFKAEVLGIIPRGLASFLKKKDIVLKVNGKSPFSRIEAYKLLNTPGDKKVEILRQGKIITFNFSKKTGQRAGVVFYRDIEEETLRQIIKKIETQNAKSPLILTSALAVLLIKKGLRKLGKRYPVLPVKSRFFGGNIKSAGLLTVDDYICAVKKAVTLLKPDYLLLPSISFDHRGRDLTGKSYLEIEELFNIRTEIL